MISVHDRGRDGAFGDLAAFRQEFYGCLTARADALFELTDAVLCTDGPVRSLVGLSLAPEHQRGHGALYDAVNCGRIDFIRLRVALAGLPLPRAGDGRLVLAADVSPWLRPDGATCPDRSFCHTYGRGKDEHRMIPGWRYSIVAALETGRTSWTAPLDAIRLAPGADVAAVTTTQIREVAERLVTAGQWREGGPEILVVLDAGYDAPRIAPVTRSSGTSIKGEHPARTGNRKLKRAFFLAAFAALKDPTSRAYYDRKRTKGKNHNAALTCLARQRCDVLFATLRNNTYYRHPEPKNLPAAT